jgi:hypothetical protein
MPLLPLISDPSLGFGTGNPTFTDASGGDPFRQWWQDPDNYLRAADLRMKYGSIAAVEAHWENIRRSRAAVRGFMRLVTFKMTADIAAGNPYPSNTKEGDKITLSEFSKEDRRRFIKMMRTIGSAAASVSGPLAVDAETIETRTYAELLTEVASSNPNIFIGYCASHIGTRGYYNTEDVAGYTLIGLHMSVLSSRDPYAMPFWFTHEILHGNSPAYDLEYEGGISPDVHVPNYLRGFYGILGKQWGTW